MNLLYTLIVEKFNVNKNHKRWKLYLDNRSGWMYIDALVGMTILVIALTALMVMYFQTTRNNGFNSKYTSGVYVAQRILEDIKQYENTATIKSLPPAVTDQQLTVNNVVYTIEVRSQTVSDAISLDSHLYPYNVKVSWTDASTNPATTRAVQVASYYYSN